MKFSTPHRFALLIAIIATLLGTMVPALFLLILPAAPLLALILSLALVFTIIFLFTRYRAYRLIMEKIDPVYRIIHNAGHTHVKQLHEDRDMDIIEKVTTDTRNWADLKSQEIDQLKQMEKYRREFLGNVSHELKTPIFNIQGYILTLLEGGIDDPAVNRMYLERSEKSINRMISIVEDLETISRLESGEQKPVPEPFDMLHLVKEVYEQLEIKAKENSIKLLIKPNDDKPVMVYADRKRIFMALHNLVINSIIYGRKDGRTVTSFTEMGNNILVEIADNGPGIDKKDIPRIFERFYRIDKSRSRNMGGTGLGLAIVKHIIEAHQQTITVRSIPGEGTVFGFTLQKA